MLKKIILKDYKCFPEFQCGLEKLTLFLGVNSGGKSSVIQALLLCAEANKKEGMTGIIDLMNSQYNSNLYSFTEVLYADADDDEFYIAVEDGSGTIFNVRFVGTEDANNVHYEISSAKGGEFNTLNIFYLPSDRRISQYQKRGNKERVELGVENEYLAYLIDKGRSKRMVADPERNLVNHNTQLFDLQINEWLDFILPGSKVTSIPSGNSGLLTLGFGNNGELHGTNVGFGIQFILPIIIAGLAARKNDLLIVENPELHLHPQAQSKLAQFLSVISKAGVQVIIETHSDHIVNGVRKAVVDQNIELPSRDVAIYYFDVNKEVTKIQLDENAEIDTWPDGFMEQTEKDLYELRRMRKLNADRADN